MNEAKVVEVADKMSPANERQRGTEARTRIPMSVPQQRLVVPEISGFHLHWMRGTAERIQQALNAGYEFVNDDEVDTVGLGVANDAGQSGNSDLGTRVSLLAGGESGPDGQPIRLYLMKIKNEWWAEDQSRMEDRNEQVARTLRGGDAGEANPHGKDHRYVPDVHRKSMADLFTRKR